MLFLTEVFYERQLNIGDYVKFGRPVKYHCGDDLYWIRLDPGSRAVRMSLDSEAAPWRVIGKVIVNIRVLTDDQ